MQAVCLAACWVASVAAVVESLAVTKHPAVVVKSLLPAVVAKPLPAAVAKLHQAVVAKPLPAAAILAVAVAAACCASCVASLATSDSTVAAVVAATPDVMLPNLAVAAASPFGHERH